MRHIFWPFYLADFRNNTKGRDRLVDCWRNKIKDAEDQNGKIWRIPQDQQNQSTNRRCDRSRQIWKAQLAKTCVTRKYEYKRKQQVNLKKRVAQSLNEITHSVDSKEEWETSLAREFQDNPAFFLAVRRMEEAVEWWRDRASSTPSERRQAFCFCFILF